MSRTASGRAPRTLYLTEGGARDFRAARSHRPDTRQGAEGLEEPRMIRAFFAVMAITVAGCAGRPPDPPSAVSEPAGLEAVATAISETLRRHHYDPAVLDDPAYLATERKVFELARGSATREAFLSGFNEIWRSGPFSHVRLTLSEASAEEVAARVDGMRVGEGASLAWKGDVAVLMVNTMMGVDTIEQINAAYEEIARRGARALIIDLRANDGGAFAVRPLVAHLIRTPYDAGAFVSQRWASGMRRPPTKADVAGVAPWDGWSIRAFWRDVQDARITRLQFTPAEPHYGGPVFVLIGPRTASAAELAADALGGSGRATLIGETTPGRMLSQKPYDLPGGMQLFLPIADYHSFARGRIEGAGVAPDVAVNAGEAMDAAMARAPGR